MTHWPSEPWKSVLCCFEVNNLTNAARPCDDFALYMGHNVTGDTGCFLHHFVRFQRTNGPLRNIVKPVVVAIQQWLPTGPLQVGLVTVERIKSAYGALLSWIV